MIYAHDIYTHIHICVCVYTYIYIYIYIYKHTHTNNKIYIHVPLHSCDYLKKISTKINLANNKGNSQNET